MKLRVALAVVCALIAGPLAGCQSIPLETQPWIEVRSENFRFVSQVEAAEAVELARSLELFKSVVKGMTKAKLFDPRVPTTIVLFKDRRSYLQFGPEYSGGLFMPTERANYALVDGSGRGIDAKGVLLHEYTHYVINNDPFFSYPIWYNEGFAELMRGTVEKDGSVIIGDVLRDRILPAEVMRELSVRRVMTESPNSLTPALTAVFYSRAWLLVQYLSYGWKVGFPDRSKQIQAYLLRVHDGMSEEQACQEAFGTNFRGLEMELEKYLRQGKLMAIQVPRSDFPEVAAPQVRTMTADEVAGELGVSALLLENPARAEPLFRSMLALRPDSARAHMGLADALRMQKRTGEYEALYERGLGLGAGEALTQLDYAQYLLARASEQGEEQRTELLTRAREHLRRAIELDPGLPEAHAELGASYLIFEGDVDVEQGFRAVERAHELLPSEARIAYLVAVAHFQANRLDEASRFVVLARGRRHEESPAVEKLAQEIEAARAGAQTASPQPGVGATP